MKRLMLAFLALAMIAVILPVGAMAATQGAPDTTPLVQGRRHVPVGQVLVWNDAVNLYVKYVATAPNYLWGIHLEVVPQGPSPFLGYENIPQANGNAIPGQFAYKADLHHESVYTQVIPLADLGAGPFFIAAHAEVGRAASSVEDLCASLPHEVTERAVVGSKSYFNIQLTGGTWLDGFYDGWCANPLVPIPNIWMGPAHVYCTYGSVPANLVDYPGNLDLVNWLLNQNFTRRGWSWQVVQSAIWKLLSADPMVGIVTLGLSPADLALVDSIVAEAQTHNDFKPGPGQFVAILLAPYEGCQLKQPNLIVQRLGCGYETAWGLGTDFWGNNWSMYFPYTATAF